MRKMRNLFLAPVALLLVLLLASCGNSQELNIPATPKRVVVITGNLQTSAAKTLPSSAITKLADALMGGGEITVIVPDSRPRATKLDPITRPQDALDENWRNYLTLLFNGDGQIAGLKDKINQAAPRKTGYDLCEALALAARENPDVIIVLGSGLSTDGALNFTQGNLLLSDDEQLALIAEKLISGKHFPDLAGVNIAWFGLGEVDGDQQPLTSQTHTVLEDLWYNVIDEAGGNVSFYPANNDGDLSQAEIEEYPDVPLVEIPIGMDDLAEVYEYEIPEIVQPIRLNDARLNFVADQDVFINPAEADAALAPIALGLIKSGQPVYILGMTAITTDNVVALNSLSLKRAVAIRDALVTLGVPASQIRCIGTGSLPNDFRTEPDTIGSVVNRAAILVDMDDDRIQQILNGKEGEDYYED
jgi:outer membrane protein OmpA-like peptidoglycan-associated protein/predicted small lipoprotein YifL